MSASPEFISPFTFVFINSDDIGGLIDDAKKKAASANQTASNTMDRLQAIKKEIDKISVTPVNPNLDNVLENVGQSGEILNFSIFFFFLLHWTYYIFLQCLFSLFLCLQWTTCGKTSHPWMLKWQRWRTWPHSSPPSATYLRT